MKHCINVGWKERREEKLRSLGGEREGERLRELVVSSFTLSGNVTGMMMMTTITMITEDDNGNYSNE
jgi:hypothetical protein